MGAYILRRILLMIPTLFGIMLVSFVVIQFAPGGPVERVIAQLSGSDTGATASPDRKAGISPPADWKGPARSTAARPNIAERRGSTRNSSSSSKSSSVSTSRPMSAFS